MSEDRPLDVADESREPLLREPEGVEGPLAFQPRQTHHDYQEPDLYPQHPFGRLVHHGAPARLARQSKCVALRSNDPASHNRLRRGPGKEQASGQFAHLARDVANTLRWHDSMKTSVHLTCTRDVREQLNKRKF